MFSGLSISITHYSPTDALAVDQLFLELQKHEHTFDPHKSTKLENAQNYKKELLETIEKQHGEMLIAKLDGKPVGLVAWYMEEEFEFDEPYGYISDIVVSKSYRGQGIGQQLLDTAVKHIKNTPVKRVHIGVLQANADTRDFYTKNGFQEYSIEMVKELK